MLAEPEPDAVKAVSVNVVWLAGTLELVRFRVKAAFVARWIVKLAALFEPAVQERCTVGRAVVTGVDAVAVRPVGFAGTTLVGMTLLLGADAGPVPAEFVAVTVKV